MAWFKCKDPVPYDEFLKTLPPAPCGDQETHYRWEIVVGSSCELCAEQARDRRKAEERAALVAEIAEKLKADAPPGLSPVWQAAVQQAIVVLRADAGPQVRHATADGLEALLSQERGHVVH